MVTIQLDERQAATILAALRFWQDFDKNGIIDSAGYVEDHAPLDSDGIDKLCESINFAEVPAIQLQRIVVSVRGGLVNCVYGEDSKVQVLVVDHDNRDDEDTLPEDKAANSEWLVPLSKLEGDTLEAVKQFDAETFR